MITINQKSKIKTMTEKQTELQNQESAHIGIKVQKAESGARLFWNWGYLFIMIVINECIFIS